MRNASSPRLALVAASAVLAIVLGAVVPATPNNRGSAASRAGAAVIPPITPPAEPPTYPTRPSQRPTGIPAISPTLQQIPAFSKQDVSNYVNTHAMPGNLAPRANVRVLQFLCGPVAPTLTAILGGPITTGLPDDTLVCFVELQGTFIFAGPAVPSADHPQRQQVSFTLGFEVFDATTGNLLIEGGIPPS